MRNRCFLASFTAGGTVAPARTFKLATLPLTLLCAAALAFSACEDPRIAKAEAEAAVAKAELARVKAEAETALAKAELAQIKASAATPAPQSPPAASTFPRATPTPPPAAATPPALWAESYPPLADAPFKEFTMPYQPPGFPPDLGDEDNPETGAKLKRPLEDFVGEWHRAGPDRTPETSSMGTPRSSVIVRLAADGTFEIVLGSIFAGELSGERYHGVWKVESDEHGTSKLKASYTNRTINGVRSKVSISGLASKSGRLMMVEWVLPGDISNELKRELEEAGLSTHQKDLKDEWLLVKKATPNQAPRTPK